MGRTRQLAAVLVAVLVPLSAVRGGDAPSPLRLIPADTDLLITVPHARQAAETVTQLQILHKLDAFSAYREALDSTSFRRFRQFLAYFEKEMGAPWPEILDEVAGGGIAVGIKFDKDKGPVLAVVQGRDEKAVRKLADISFRILAEEAARTDEQAKPATTDYHGTTILHIGEKLYAAAAGSAILLSDHESTLHAALDLQRGGGGGKSCFDKPGVQESSKLVPANALASLWLNLDVVRRQPGAAAAFKKGPRDDPAQTIIFGGYLDIVGRSPYLTASVLRDKDDVVLSVRLPSGRTGMGVDSLLHVPPKDDVSLPLLQPAGVMFSTSFYINIASIWNDRKKLFPEKVAASFEKADKETNLLLASLRISKILPQVGAHHRFVVANQPTSNYKSPGGFPIPAFALVSELRQPNEFAKTMETTLRGAALLGSFQFKLKLVEEKVKGVALVAFRFDENQPGITDFDPSILRYYSPCFARVGDQFLWSSNIELARDLIGCLQTESKTKSADAGTSRVFASGAAHYLESIQDVLVTQAVLDRALSVEDAAAELKAFLALLQSLGPLDITVRYDEERFNYDFRLKGLK
jgi:hypothetical protein